MNRAGKIMRSRSEIQRSQLYERNLGNTTPIQKRAELGKLEFESKVWLVSGIAAGF